MRLTLGRVRRAVIVAPHPDDEIIGAAGLIQVLRRQGAQVRVIVVSDGAASHPGSPTWPSARLIAARARESRHALRRLGMCHEAVTFLGLPDSGLSTDRNRCRHALHRALRKQGGMDLLVGPAVTDEHPDHQAVAIALRDYRFAGRRLTYQVWPPQRRMAVRCRTVAVPGGAAAKCSLIRSHRTQLGAITDDPQGFSIAPHELAVFAHPIEYFVEER